MWVAPVTLTPDYPINIRLADAPVLVIGGGHIAARKVDGLLASGAAVTVVSPTIVAELVGRVGVRWHQRKYQRGEVASYRLAIAATGVRAVDEQISADAQAAGIPVNIADVPDLCTFTLPSILRRGDLQVTVSSKGRSPAFSSWVRRELDRVIDDTYAQGLDIVASVRDELHTHGRTTEIRGWHEAFDDGFLDLVASGDHDAARLHVLAHLGLDRAQR